MSKLLLVCVREGTTAPGLRDVLVHLAPDNLAAPRIVEHVVDQSLRIGALEPDAAEGGLEPSFAMVGSSEAPLGGVGASVPEGSFAGVRWSAEVIELVADAAGSRTLWYLETPSLFAASTSQRALVRVSGLFEPNHECVAWMLASGTLGPGLSWDRRIRAVPPNTVVNFERRRWCSSPRTRETTRFKLGAGDERAHRRRLEEALDATLSRITMPSDWVLPLSGGFDSRALLWALRSRKGVRCLTWGTRASLDDPCSDAGVARSVAREAGADFEFVEIDPGEVPATKVLDRYLVAGEGRVDHLSGYLDGLLIWERLRARGVRGIVRGDEGFGWLPAKTSRKARLTVGLATLRDYANADDLRAHGVSHVLREPDCPRWLARLPDEPVETWRDRLYHQFRIPTILAALHEVKTPFLEVSNPFLAGRILTVVRQLPDHLRTNKALFRSLCEPQRAWGQYATRGANPTLETALARPDFRAAMRAELVAPRAHATFDRRWLERVGAYLDRAPGASRRSASADARGWGRRVPTSVRHHLQDWLWRDRLAESALAIRTFIVLRMHRFLDEDQRAPSGRR